MPASEGSIRPLTVAAYTPPRGGPEGLAEGLTVGTRLGVGLAVLSRLGLVRVDGAAVARQALSTRPSSSTLHRFHRWLTR